MAAKSKQPYNYVAHIQREGRVTELAGTREDYSMKKVYQFLLELATEMGGWLLAEQITDADDNQSRCTYNEKEIEPIAEDEVKDEGITLGADGVWNSYTKRYAGAQRLTFKEGS
jgi:hypothetical protein